MSRVDVTRCPLCGHLTSAGFSEAKRWMELSRERDKAVAENAALRGALERSKEAMETAIHALMLYDTEEEARNQLTAAIAECEAALKGGRE
jgi:hypothetical protein